MSKQNRKEAANWMYECLAEAKSIIKKYHDVDAKTFLNNTTFELYIQNNSANHYVQLVQDSSHFQIGINPVLSDNSFQNQKTLVIVLARGLLYCMHTPNQDKIDTLEIMLADKGGYLDALAEIKNQASSQKMTFCSI